MLAPCNAAQRLANQAAQRLAYKAAQRLAYKAAQRLALPSLKGSRFSRSSSACPTAPLSQRVPEARARSASLGQRVPESPRP